MSEQEAVRRLVKSGPELWAQCSDPLLLSKHLAAFGEITITRLEPESAVAWEGESGSGTVSLEASGWGTRVRLTAAPSAAPGSAAPESAAPVPEARVAPPLELTPKVTVAPRRFGALISSLLNRRRAVAAPQPPAPETVTVVEAEPAPVATTETEAVDLVAELEAALDSLGAAHHRPYSRS